MLRAAGMWRVFEQRRTIDVSADLETSRQFRDMRMRWQRVQREIERHRIVRPGERAHVCATADLAADQSLASGKLIGPRHSADRHSNR